jgi:hypothetical protein
MADRAHLERLTKELAEAGKLIEAGWVGLRLMAIPLDAPAAQLTEMRMAFFAGAQHLFGSLTGSKSVLEDTGDPDEITPGDMRRMDLIDKELRGFIEDFKFRHVPTKGTA